jgi:hypothetical protein
MLLTERIALDWRPPVDVLSIQREARHPSVIAALQRPGVSTNLGITDNLAPRTAAVSVEQQAIELWDAPVPSSARATRI